MALHVWPWGGLLFLDRRRIGSADLSLRVTQASEPRPPSSRPQSGRSWGSSSDDSPIVSVLHGGTSHA